MMRFLWRISEWIPHQLRAPDAIFDARKAIFYLSFWGIWLKYEDALFELNVKKSNS